MSISGIQGLPLEITGLLVIYTICLAFYSILVLANMIIDFICSGWLL